MERRYKDKEVSFNEFFQPLWRLAQARGLMKREWLEKAGFSKQRFCDWENSRQPLTGRTLIKLLEVLKVGSIAELEKIAKQNLTEEQRQELSAQFFLRKNPDVIQLLLEHPELVAELKQRIPH